MERRQKNINDDSEKTGKNIKVKILLAKWRVSVANYLPNGFFQAPFAHKKAYLAGLMLVSVARFCE